MTVFISAVALNASGSLNPGPLAITVPADAQGVLVFTRAFNNPNLSITSSFTGAFAVSQDTGTERTAVARAPVTATGAQTISPTWTVIPSEGPLFVVAFVKGIDTSSFATWVRGVGVRADDAVGSAFGLSVASAAADLVLAFDSRYSATQTPPADEAGWTSRFTQGFSGNGGRLRSANSPGAATTTANTQGDQYRGLGLVSIMGSAAGANSLAANAAALASGSAVLLKGVSFTAAAVAQATGAASLSQSVPLAASGVAVVLAGAQLSLIVNLAGAGLASVAATAGVAVGKPLAAAAAAQAAASADMQILGANTLGAAAVAGASASALLSLVVSLSGQAVAQVQASAALASGQTLAANAVASASAGATIWVDVRLGAQALAQAVGAGVLNLQISLASNALAGATASAQLSRSVLLSAAGAALSEAEATLQVLGSLGTFEKGMVATAEPRSWQAAADRRSWRAAQETRSWRVTP